MNAEDLASWIRHAAELVAADAGRLTRLDAAIGDGDHGHNLDRGFRAAVEALPDGAPPGRVLIAAGRAIVSKTGGASGPLYGTALRRAGKALGTAEDVDAAALGAALKAALEGVKISARPPRATRPWWTRSCPPSRPTRRRSAAAPAWRPACAPPRTPRPRGRTPRSRCGRARAAPAIWARAAGHLDPGASSTALLLRALADVAGEE